MQVRNRRPAAALESHSKSELVPDTPRPVNFAFGKEVLLALYTTMRPERHPVVDYIFREAKRRNAGVFTTSHVLAEVMGTVKSNQDTSAAIQLWNAIMGSKTYVLHGARRWDLDDSRPKEKDIASSVKELYQTRKSIDFKFHEGTLVLDAAKLNEERGAETTYVVSLDGKLTNLAWNENVNVLPSRTPHRSDDLS